MADTDTMIRIGDTVKWSNGRKPLGKVVHLFVYKGKDFAVVDTSKADSYVDSMIVVRVYEKLLKV